MLCSPSMACMTPAERLDHLNHCSPDDFCAAMADIWEHAPWVAAQTVAQRPFASADALHSAMLAVVAGLDEPARIRFYAGHPELGGELARTGAMNAASTDEQASLGLGQLQAAEAQRWDGLNRAYRERFGFPFILCIRQHSLASALLVFEQRLGHTRQRELQLALNEIAAISRLRLARYLQEADPAPVCTH